MKKIETVEQLKILADSGKCVNWHGKHLPANAVLNMQARVVLKAIERGLYMYEPKQTEKKAFPVLYKSKNE
jgi:hypothetical protein